MGSVTKRVSGFYQPPAMHWVGDGFPVKTLFFYNDHGAQLSPFLMLDYAGPRHFEPSEVPKGVGEHPHRGFETVTVVYQGELEHKDSAGGGGRIGPGDVQWMTAGAGVMHQEFHAQEFAAIGGTFEAIQLWVNLPARHKMTEPRYQTLRADDIPMHELADGAGQVRVIAGNLEDVTGAAKVHSPMNVWEVTLNTAGEHTLTVEEGHTTAIVGIEGRVDVNGSQPAGKAELVVLSRKGTGVTFRIDGPAKFLLLSGEPLDEPVVGYGPFVMNTREEILQALSDAQSDKFGRLPTEHHQQS